MEKIVFASNNSHKLSEIRQLNLPFEILSLAETGCKEDIPETADTLEGNALQKARWVKDHYGYDCFADDTGLEVVALGGEPGVYSARYAGEGHDSEANMAKLLANMEGVKDRRARFRTVIALIKDGEEHFFVGIVEGHITTARSGADGFGYDPIFMPEGCDKTFAEMTADEKNAISHRGRAVAELKNFFKNS